MDEALISVRVLPKDVTVRVEPGDTLRGAAALAGITLDSPCGGQGNCGKCQVRVIGEGPERTGAERALLSHEALEQGLRLACQVQVRAPLAFEIPDTSHLAPAYQILMDTAAPALSRRDPVLRAEPVALLPPTLQDDEADLERLQRALGPLQVDLDLARALPARLRAGRYRGTAVISGGRLLDFASGGPWPRCLAAAFDIGTTTLAAVLLDPEMGRVLARASRLNPQTGFGDDVLARISYAGGGAAQLERLRSDVVRAANAMLAELAESAGASVEDIYEIAFTGNTIMQHLLLGIDPAPIGVSPFVPAVSGPIDVAAADAGFQAHPKARCHVFPVIAGYVGGDTVAGVLATRLSGMPPPVLFIDIGTNGELVLLTEDGLVATSCAAGPAFEGVRIKQGMRAAAGAIEAIRLEEDAACKVIGGARPIGLCGSGLIDLVAELLRVGLLSWTGELFGPDETPDGLPDAIRARVCRIRDETAFLVVEPEETHTGQAILLYQSDVREVQLATAAVRAAVRILLERTGTAPASLKRVLVAGAFGNYIRCENAQRMGLLPPEVDPGRFTFSGNTALAGARLAALSQSARQDAETLARRTEHIDLSLDPLFQDIYVESMFFPQPVEGSYQS